MDVRKKNRRKKRRERDFRYRAKLWYSAPETGNGVRFSRTKEKVRGGQSGGCYSLNQKPGSGKSILRFAIKAIIGTVLKHEETVFHEGSHVEPRQGLKLRQSLLCVSQHRYSDAGFSKIPSFNILTFQVLPCLARL